MCPRIFGFRDFSAKGPKLLFNGRQLTFFQDLTDSSDSVEYVKMMQKKHSHSTYSPDIMPLWLFDEMGITSDRFTQQTTDPITGAVMELIKGKKPMIKNSGMV